MAGNIKGTTQAGHLLVIPALHSITTLQSSLLYSKKTQHVCSHTAENGLAESMHNCVNIVTGPTSQTHFILHSGNFMYFFIIILYFIYIIGF